MWQVVETALDLLDVLLHWRFYACFLVGLLAAFLLHRHFPDPDVGPVLAIVAGALGLVAGLLWELGQSR